MQYKVLSASLRREDGIYKQGEYIEIGSKKDAERLSSFGCILIEKAEQKPEKVKEVETIKEVKELKEVEAVKTVKPQERKQYGGKKKK
jgi:hypothetical protein